MKRHVSRRESRLKQSSLEKFTGFVEWIKNSNIYYFYKLNQYPIDT